MNKKTLNKVNIAIEQLEVALSLFLNDKSYVSALTLSGAAEDILGNALKHKNKENSLQELYKIYNRPGLEWVNPPKTWNEFTKNGQNKIRNSIKHFNLKNELEFEADIEDEAIWMLTRACENYNRLGLSPTKLMTEFENYFFENVVGL